MSAGRSDKDTYRLKPMALNALVNKHVHTTPYDGVTMTLSVSESTINFHRVQRDDTIFYLFDMTKDSMDKKIESDLLSFTDVVHAFCQTHQAEEAKKSILLMPLRLCRGYLRIAPRYLPEMLHVRRKHAVLVEINLNDKYLQVHDSEGLLRWLAYGNLGERVKTEFVKHEYYHAYGRQGGWLYSDVISCGYFVFEYIKYILSTGSSKGCENIVVNAMSECTSMQDYLEKQGVAITEVCYAIPPEENDRPILSFDDDDESMEEWVMVKPEETQVIDDVVSTPDLPSVSSYSWLTSLSGWWSFSMPTSRYALNGLSLFQAPIAEKSKPEPAQQLNERLTVI